MSINRLVSSLISVEGEQLYEIPKGMKSVLRLSIGSRSLNYGTSFIDGKRYIVLLEPIELSGVKIEVVGK